MTNKPRRISEFLPEVLQTDILQKFFAATGDQLFQPDNVEYLSAYIGEKPPYYDPNTDKYVSEINRDRRDYQLPPTTVSRDQTTNEVTHTLFYDDLINKLRFQGALVNDHNRLFENEYYSFGVPIDLDKFVNYQNYVWLPEGPLVLTLIEPLNPLTAIIGQQTYNYVGYYTYPDPANPDILVYNEATSDNPLVFTNGIKVQFFNDVTISNRKNTYIVEGVGQSIRLVADNLETYLAWSNPEEYDSTVWDYPSTYNVPNYICMGRGSANANPWSLGNRWFHKDVLKYTNTVLENYNQAAGKRPILEFQYDLKLWNFAQRNRGFITLVDTTSKYLSDIDGQWVTTIYPSGRRDYLQIDGVTLDDDMVILFTNLLDPEQNNKLYKVTNVRNSYYPLVNPTQLGQVILGLLPNGDDIMGAPVDGDGVLVTAGSLESPTGAQHVNTYWYYSSVSQTWIQGQNRQITSAVDPTSVAYRAILNQSPLFDLFDTQGNYLGNNSIYPTNNFTGCSIFEYASSTSSPVDPVLGFATVTENQSARNFVFANTIVTNTWTYQQNLVLQPIPGYKFFARTNQGASWQYLNNWLKSSVPSRQYVVNEFVSVDDQNTFVIDQAPALAVNPQNPAILEPTVPGPLPITVNVGTELLQLNVDYTVTDRQVILNTPLAANQFVKIRSYAGIHNSVSNGYFEIPNNLAVNPNNQDIETISVASLLPHFESVILNQAGFQGNVIGSNNYRDLAQDQSLGTVLLQNRAPMLKLMGTNAVNQTTALDTSSSLIDPFAAMVWAQGEYLRFYNKVVNSLMNLWLNQGYTTAQTPTAWLAQALTTVNLGKTKASTWANSGFDLTNGAYCSEQSTNPTWVPPSATRLGVTPAYYPEVFYDTTQPNEPLSMRCHNGAIVVMKDYSNQDLGEIVNNFRVTSDPAALTNPVAQAWLLFELRMYESLPLKYKDPQVQLPVDLRTIFSGKYRVTSYTRQDQLAIQSPSWQKWLTFNQVDAFKNITFDLADPFTWNYSSCVDQDGMPVPGHWRGIYFWFYDTARPHTAPWQMLGFSQKPSWWDQEYGAAPYTSGNTRMWDDLEQGRIAQGPRAGIDDQWARPGLSKCIPVNSAGELLPPFLAGCVTSLPSTTEASADWKFGDRGPLENVWLTQVDSDIQWAQWMYLTVPAQFMEYLWDGARQQQVYADQEFSQYIYSDQLARKSSADFYVHRENPQDVTSLANPLNLDYFGSCGIQHWISERLVSDSRNVTTYFGNIIRGLNVNLAHRLGGFTDSQNTKLFVESFGIGGNNSLLLPQEDMSTELLRSSSTGEYVYTGVIVEFRGAGIGWRVIGYDGVNPYFTIIPSNIRGPKNTVVIDNQRVIEYSRGLATTAQVAYGTIFATRQEVYDFLISLGRAQIADGWQFDQYDDVAGRPRNWSLSAREFLFWSQGPWAPGTYITLSPLATLAKFSKEFGIIQNVGGIVNGTYSVLDRLGQSILLKDLDFLRIDDQISVRPLNDQGIFGLRLYTTTLEHAFVFNNTTIFNDLVYDPVLNQRQSRFKIFGYRTLNWRGRMEAPGYMITQTLEQTSTTISILNRIIPNFEKSADDLRKLFEIDLATSYIDATNPQQATTSTITQSLPLNLSLMAKNVVGYVPRPYLTDLLVDENIAFQFYQGMIHQKGTATAINRLLRNRNVLEPNQDFNYYEEWAFRAGIYGNDLDVNSLDVRLDSTAIQSNPQLATIFGNSNTDLPNDDTYTVYAQDARIIDQTAFPQPFRLRETYGSQPDDLPTAGYVLLGDTTYTVPTYDALLALYSDRTAANIADSTQKPLQAGDTVWQFIDSLRTWNIWKIYQPTWQILTTSPSDFDVTITEVTTSDSHYLVSGDLVVIYGVINAGVAIDNTFVVTVTSTTTFEITLSSSNIGSGGSVLLYKSIRFANTQARDAAAIPGGWTRGDIVYIDGSSTTPWQVLRNSGINWYPVRTENYKTDPRYINTSFIYDLTTGNTIANLVYWDPAKNRLPGIFDVEITYKTPYDPAQYTHDPSTTVGINAANAWGNDQVGLVWWDLNTMRFIDYEIGTDSYRRQHWGSIAPGTTVDIYEWVRSTVPPASWQDLVAKGTDLSAIGSTNLPSGQVKSDNQPYVLRQQLNSLGQLVDVYYFWVKNTTTVPDVSWRHISTSILSNIIAEPGNTGISWWSAINSTSALLGNIGYTLNGNNSIWHLSWLKTLDAPAVHKEYDLMRPDDPRSSPYEYLWTRLRNSLVEFDNQSDVVPGYALTDRETYGIQSRPAQTMFEDRNGARKAFVTYVNQLLASASSPTATDVSRFLWREYFNAQEPIPAQRNTKPAVVAATTDNLSAYYINGSDGVAAQLIAKTTQLLIVDSNRVPVNPGDPNNTTDIITGYYPSVGDRILIKNQINNAHNGIYTVVKPGTLIYPNALPAPTQSRLQLTVPDPLNPSRSLIYTPAQGQYIFRLNTLYVVTDIGGPDNNWQATQVAVDVANKPDQLDWILQRTSDFDQESDQLFNSEVYVESGSQMGYWTCDPSGISVVTAKLSNPGINYRIGDVLYFDDGEFWDQAGLKVTTVDNSAGDVGPIASLEIYDNGNYTVVPDSKPVQLYSPGSGVSAGAVKFLIVSANVNIGGNGFTVGDELYSNLNGNNQDEARLTVTGVTNGQVQTVEITDGGIFAQSQIPLSLTNVAFLNSGTGGGCTLDIVFGIQSIAVNSGGSNYQVAPSVVISGGNGSGTSATANAIMVNNSVSLLLITNPGSGYTQNPSISFVQGSAARAILTWSDNQGFAMGSKPITFRSGRAPTTWDQQVSNLAQLNDLKYQIIPGTKVLVADTSLGNISAGSETNNRWNIWLWPNRQPNSEFVLQQTQSYVDALCWSLTDWYSTGYNSDTIADYTFDTLDSRDAYLDFQQLDIVKVNNTGSGSWALYLYVDLSTTKWVLIGEQNGTVVLNDNLYDYDKYNMGFSGAGFAQDFQGFEYDSRQELDNIIQGLWVGAQGIGGLLKIDNVTNEPNQVFFTMLNRIFHEQDLVDWAFKTSFINLRGFAEQLIASPYYTTSKINSLLEYINEIKPYHAKIRQFVDWKISQDTYTNNSTDFDKPPYKDPVTGVRILDPYNEIDGNIMIQSREYKYWLENYLPTTATANPQLIRNIRTKLIFERLACSASTWYNPDLEPQQLQDLLALPVNVTITSLVQWLTTIYSQNIEQNYKAEVAIPQFVIMRRNDNSNLTDILNNWDFIDYGLNFTQTYGLADTEASKRTLVESQSIYTSQQLFDLLDNSLQYTSGYQIKVRIDDWTMPNIYLKTSADTQKLSDWLLLSYQQYQGSINTIHQYYSPSGTQTPLDSEYLISGCAGKLLTVDGAEFSNQDAWDKTTWDNVRGWDYSQDAYDPYDQNITDGMGPGYWIYVGNGVRTEFGLPVAPQNPNELTVWVNGTPIMRAGNWSIDNFVSQMYVINSGINYNTNDVITAVGGTYVRPAQFKVTGHDNLGHITSLAIVDPGEYSVVPDSNLVNVTGGQGTNAVLNILWGGKTIVFATAPSVPVQPRPNIWIVEKGSTFHPVVSGLLGTTLDGSGLNRPHLEPGHPEELNPVWNRDSLVMDVYTLPSGGYGNLVTKVYTSDGLLDQFDIGQPITNNYQLFVYVNGVSQVQGALADYVIAFDTMRVVFVNPPLPGRVSIISVGFGGASQGLGSLTIISKGAGYNIGDDITLDGGIPYEPSMVAARAVVTVTAVSAVSVNIISGGQDYVVGDLLSLKYGYSTAIVILRVSQVTNTINTKGIISDVEIVNGGYYLSTPNSISFFSSGEGQGADLIPVWGVAQVSIKDAGVYFQTPGQAGQLSVTPSSGTGFAVSWGPSAIRQQQQWVSTGDNILEWITFDVAIAKQYVLVVKNGEEYQDWYVDNEWPNSVILQNVDNPGDVYVITLFASSLSSRIHTQTWMIQDDTQLSYVLDNPPQQSVVQSLNALVFVNNVKVRPPYFWQGTGDGTTTVWDIGIDTTMNPTIVAWENISTVAISAGPGAQQVTFAVAPVQGSQIYVEVDKDNDYTIVGDSIVFETGVISNNDLIEVQTFTEDSSTRYTSDRWQGATSGIYSLSATPSNWGSIQVWVNGVLADSSWDYIIKVVDGVTEIQFGTQWTHTINDEIQSFYYTGIPAKPAVAFRMFQNIFGDVQYQRLSNQNTTTLSQDLLADDEYVYVSDGTVVADPNPNMPGVIWVGNERIEYAEKIAEPIYYAPLQYKLGKLVRGSLGTSGGRNIQFTSEFHSGNSVNTYFKTSLVSTSGYIFVDGVLQLLDLNYGFEDNPPGLVPGTYVKFFGVKINETDTVAAPPLGNKNIVFVENVNNPAAYLSTTLVRDGSVRQNIPAGYIWTSGVGIQYGNEPQTAFLLEQPGTRQGK